MNKKKKKEALKISKFNKFVKSFFFRNEAYLRKMQTRYHRIQAHFSMILKNKEIIARDGKMNLFETKELFMA